MKKVRYAVGAAAAAPILGMAMPAIATAATTHVTPQTAKKSAKMVSLARGAGATALSVSVSPDVACTVGPNTGYRAKTATLDTLFYNHFKFTNGTTKWTCVGFIGMSTVYPAITSDGVYIQRPGHHYCAKHWPGYQYATENCYTTFRRPFTVVGWGLSIHGNSYNPTMKSS